MKDNQPLVSVCMVTYNHEAYIAQAIESVMMQEGPFEIELIIGEDCSTDNTRTICESYAKQYPNIRLLARPQNLGMMSNFIDVFNHCQGKYVALLDGDDYWTDVHKLKKQMEYLTLNQDLDICSHITDELVNGTVIKLKERGDRYLSFQVFATSGCAGVYTSSMFFRNLPLIRETLNLPWVLNIDGADLLILFLLTANGRSLYIIPQPMSVYRKHSGGIWSATAPVVNAKSSIRSIEYYKKYLNLSSEQIHYLNWLKGKFLRQIIYSKFNNQSKLIRAILIRLIYDIPLFKGPGKFSSKIIDLLHKYSM